MYNHSPKDFANVKSKSKWSPKNSKNAAFSQQKCPISFPLSQSKSGPDPNFEEIYSPNPIQIQQNLL